MVIDKKIEASVRSLLNAAVKSDESAFEDAARSLSDGESQTKALELAVAICLYVIFDTYDGKPTAGDVEEIAQAVVEMGSWATLTSQEVSKFLGSVLNGKALAEVFDPQSAFFLTFIITGSLLAASPKISKGEWWFNYLDRVEAAIETATSGK